MVDNDPTPPDHAPQHTTIPWHRLSDGGSIPGIGFGTLVQSRQYQAATEQAIAHGYRLIDTALRYDNERDVGAAVRASGVARQNLVITTKIRGDVTVMTPPGSRSKRPWNGSGSTISILP